MTSDARIRASATIEAALKQGAKVMVTSHLGRPTEGEYNEEFSLLPVVNYLKEKLNGTNVTRRKTTSTALKWARASWWCWKTFALTKARKRRRNPVEEICRAV